MPSALIATVPLVVVSSTVSVEIGPPTHLDHTIGVLARRPDQQRRLAEGLPERALGLALELDEDRADLQPDVPALEQRQRRIQP